VGSRPAEEVEERALPVGRRRSVSGLHHLRPEPRMRYQREHPTRRALDYLPPGALHPSAVAPRPLGIGPLRQRERTVEVAARHQATSSALVPFAARRRSAVRSTAACTSVIDWRTYRMVVFMFRWPS